MKKSDFFSILISNTQLPDTSKIDLNRYRKIRRFFAKAFLHVIWWDIILNRPILKLFRTPAISRWQIIARQYRALAVEMGGVLIKLGQFLSIRVDILPTEVTSELSGLQDEVPPELPERIIAQIEEDFGRPVSQIFEWFSPLSIGAASLAQAHLAKIRISDNVSQASCLQNHNKQDACATLKTVVVKVLRPGIDVLVETDLTAIRLAFQWLKIYKRIRDRVDLDWLAEEFTTVTRKELDFQAEGQHAEQLARDFADDAQVYIPQIYWEYCAARTLTLENVGYIKIGDLEAIEAAGISRAKVADKLYNIYMKQVFETFFVHVDPHPGNLFVKPLPHLDEIRAGIIEFAPDDPVFYKPDRDFQIAFVDFGMAVTIHPRLRSALREYAIGIGTRDAHKIVQSLVNSGTLLAGADLKRLKEVHEDFFSRLWGIRVGQFRDMALDEARHFFREYKDVIYEAPLQFQADTLFIARAVGMLSGMAANLDPEFDVWEKTIPYAERYAMEELHKTWQEWLRETAALGHAALKLPVQIEQVFTRIQQDKLMVQTAFTPESRKEIQRLEKSVNRLTWITASAGLLISGAILHVGSQGKILSIMLIFMAFIGFVQGIRK